MHLKRIGTTLHPDQSRVLLRPFNPGGPERGASIIVRIMALPEERVGLAAGRSFCRVFPARMVKILNLSEHMGLRIAGRLQGIFGYIPDTSA
jgi:hypothetical protein